MKLLLTMIVGGKVDEKFVTAALDNVSESVDYAIVNFNADSEDPFYRVNRERIVASHFSQEGRLTLREAPFVNFSQARNVCLEESERFSPEWILRLDADEVVYPDRFNALVETLEKESARTVRVPFWHLLHMRLYQEKQTCALFSRFIPGRRWIGAVHERLQGGDGSVAIRGEEFSYVHYSYTLPPRQIHAKWSHYASLEGKRETADPETLIDDRYAIAAPFLEAHPPGADAVLDREVREGRIKDRRLNLLAVVCGPDPVARLRTVENLSATRNPDYPLTITEVGGDLWAGWNEAMRVEAERGEWEFFLFIPAGATFAEQGWQKSLVNTALCKRHSVFTPEGSVQTVMVERAVLSNYMQRGYRRYPVVRNCRVVER